MNKPFDWDVFLSHSSIDKPRVARLAERLTEAGFHVWFDRPNIDSGEDIVTAIEQGLERSRVLVLCMTKAAFESEWVRLERNTATFRDPGNHDRRFLPPRLDNSTTPSTSVLGIVRIFRSDRTRHQELRVIERQGEICQRKLPALTKRPSLPFADCRAMRLIPV